MLQWFLGFPEFTEFLFNLGKTQLPLIGILRLCCKNVHSFVKTIANLIIYFNNYYYFRPTQTWACLINDIFLSFLFISPEKKKKWELSCAALLLRRVLNKIHLKIKKTDTKWYVCVNYFHWRNCKWKQRKLLIQVQVSLFQSNWKPLEFFLMKMYSVEFDRIL